MPLAVGDVVPGDVGVGVAPMGTAFAVGEELTRADGGGGAVLNDGVGQIMGLGSGLVIVREAEVGILPLGSEGDVALLVLDLDLILLVHVGAVGQSLGEIVDEGDLGGGGLVLHVADRDVAGKGIGGVAPQVGLHIRHNAVDGIDETALGVPGGIAGALQADDLEVEGACDLVLGGDLQGEVGVIRVVDDGAVHDGACRHGGIAVALPLVELEGALIGIVGVGSEIRDGDLQKTNLGIEGEGIAHGVVQPAHVGSTARTVSGELNLTDTAEILLGGGGQSQPRQDSRHGRQEKEGGEGQGE